MTTRPDGQLSRKARNKIFTEKDLSNLFLTKAEVLEIIETDLKDDCKRMIYQD